MMPFHRCWAWRLIMRRLGTGMMFDAKSGSSRAQKLSVERLRWVGIVCERLPDIVEEVMRSGRRPSRQQAAQAGAAIDALGMSYEVTDVEVMNWQEKVWVLTRATFTGAAILRRQNAAYRQTWIELGVGKRRSEVTPTRND